MPDQQRVLTIREARLPDLDDPDEASRRGYRAYGRLALLRSGGLWFGDARSSHPGSSRIGWYWAIDADGNVLVSARGCNTDIDELLGVDRKFLAWLLTELERRRLIARPLEVLVLTKEDTCNLAFRGAAGTDGITA